MIQIKNLIKKYGDNYIFKNFNYEFNCGLYLIKGSSGKGKTTLLNMIGGEDKKYKGEISVSEEILYFKDKDNLPSDLMVKEVYYLYEKVNEEKLVEFFDVQYLMNKKIKKLSLGEIQLVILNMVFNSKNKIIVLDEPCSALSINNLKKASSMLEKLSSDKIIILSSHNINDFNKYTLLDLDNFKKNKRIKKFVCCNKRYNKKFKLSYYLLYLKKTFFRKIVFLFSVILTIFNFVYVNNYGSSLINDYLKQLDYKKGVIIEKVNEVKELNDHVFYEIIKNISSYVINYNANYYNSDLYNYNVSVNGLYIDNGFVLSSFNYIERSLDENEIIIGFNYNSFCGNQGITICDENYLKKTLINKRLDSFNLYIKDIFYNNETVIFSNERFKKVHDKNEYIEYYFDVKKENADNVFKIINDNNFLLNFNYIKIGENNDEIRYKVNLNESKKFNNIDYSKYIVCLENGYDCLNYLNHFKTLVSIDEFNDISMLDLELIDDLLNIDEIVISSKLSEVLNKYEGDNISFYFNYGDVIKNIKLTIKKIIKNDSYLIYQNSKWSYDFFKEKVRLNEEHLQIKNIVIYDNIKDGDIKSNDIYENALKEVKSLLNKTKNIVIYTNIILNMGSLIVLVLLEVFCNKFKKEYLRYLKILGIKKVLF